MPNRPSTSQIVLAIDTAGPRLQLALTGESKTDAHILDLPRGHAELIFQNIDVLLARNGKTYEDVQRIAVTTGPGSFTGLRIGLSAARGLGLALDIPVIGIPTLQAMSLSADKEGTVTVAVDARRDETYIQDFKKAGVPDGPPMILPNSEAEIHKKTAQNLIIPVVSDIALLAEFAINLDPKVYPPNPTYVRAADAKPQQKAKIARNREPVQ